MSTITLPNIRVSSDLTVKVRLKDGGVAIDWSTLSGIRALIYSDAQRAMAGRCAVSVDAEDATLLVCQYAANKPQYIGVNRIVISATYLGEMKTYDKPALNFVRWTDDQAGQEITISDPDVEVEIEVEDVSSSILQEAVDAAFSAAERAEEAAAAAEHMVDIHTGPAGKSPYIGENGNWFEWDETTHQYVDTEEKAKGDTGETPDITIGTVTTVEPGTPAAATMTGTPEAPVLNLSIPKGVAGDTPAFTVGEVTTGEPGTQVIVTITGTAAAPVLNVTIPQGLQGNTGSSVDYPYELVNNCTTNDATKGLSAAQGKALKDEIDQLDLKVDENEESGKAVGSVSAKKTTVDFSALDLRSYYINPSGDYGTYSTYKHNVLPVSPGDTILVKAGAQPAYLAWLASKKEPTSGGTPIYAPGYSGRFLVPDGESMMLTAPEGAFYLYVYRGDESDSYPYTPDSVVFVKNATDAVIFKSVETTKTPTILRDDQNAIVLCTISASGKIASSETNGNRGYYIQVEKGQRVRLWAITNNSRTISYGFCPSLPEVGTQLTNYYVSPSTLELDDTMDVPYDGYFFVARNTGYFSVKFQFSVIDTDVAWTNKANKADTLGGYGIEDAYTKTQTDEKLLSFSLGADVVGDGDNFVFTKYIANVIPGNTYRVLVKNPDVSMDGVTISSDRYRFGIYFYDSVKSQIERTVGVATNKPLDSSYDVVAPAGAAYMRVGVRCAEDATLGLLFSDATTGGDASLADIVDANPDSEWIPKMMAAKKRYYTSTLNNLPHPFVLAHLSDIHGNWANVARFLKWCNHHGSRIDLLVNTGDTAENTYDSDLSGYLAIDGVEDIINVIGNHDTRSSEDTSDWQAHTGIDAYNKFIAPFVASWDVVQPEDAAVDGKCYFYKDEPEKSLRLLFVDIMGYDATQDAWVRNVLADARTNGYHTLVVTHYAPARSYAERNEPSHEVVPCNYSSLYGSGSDSSNLTAYNVNSYLLGESVHDYMEAGGVFIGYLGGHYHREIIAKQGKYPEQMFFAVGATKAGEHRDYLHTTGTRDQDEFEIVSIDTYVKTITFYKVGANVDKYGRHKNSICINYETGTLKAEAF